MIAQGSGHLAGAPEATLSLASNKSKCIIIVEISDSMLGQILTEKDARLRHGSDWSRNSAQPAGSRSCWDQQTWEPLPATASCASTRAVLQCRDKQSPALVRGLFSSQRGLIPTSWQSRWPAKCCMVWAVLSKGEAYHPPPTTMTLCTTSMLHFMDWPALGGLCLCLAGESLPRSWLPYRGSFQNCSSRHSSFTASETQRYRRPSPCVPRASYQRPR